MFLVASTLSDLGRTVEPVPEEAIEEPEKGEQKRISEKDGRIEQERTPAGQKIPQERYGIEKSVVIACHSVKEQERKVEEEEKDLRISPIAKVGATRPKAEVDNGKITQSEVTQHVGKIRNMRE